MEVVNRFDILGISNFLRVRRHNKLHEEKKNKSNLPLAVEKVRGQRSTYIKPTNRTELSCEFMCRRQCLLPTC